ncbi:RpiB/LacA/LacB family sugar-phosphate isomerase [Selenomonas sp.]|uniref:RpiB/LacA/LacB family sugar-phosphate isomerase n=1 Tax=Selenomonas sp. TaxID=2053611 RepID=UPI0025CCC9E0|nr:RpiB/LacA/LacB family sugar-phosphate isomerase [Selenomonas sp.]MCI6084960.1 RpiB/LacA/LacB family sugar-phosphate isomerase [Selenomonas sp.]MCI6284463.1 RpiB/LacA/LacB family sugar-phosphate isomerase [Selenomonas sp.]MDY3297845.1 RpiB/LacA/LacB family sugar-phosphate isomerase [Selenomonas sp.]MDY4414911.1 RpiB/LacA/LacB family sugar-phosphate isomerase [Selenomonas sp.]
MKVAIAANAVGKELKDCVKSYLAKKGYEMVDLSDDDIFTATMNVVKAIQGGEITRGIVVDDYAVAPFMIASKNHGIVCAPTYEDYTSSMTRHHNSTQIIALAANITAPVLSCQLAENFCKTEYDGGRHQVRIDMMNRIL